MTMGLRRPWPAAEITTDQLHAQVHRWMHGQGTRAGLFAAPGGACQATAGLARPGQDQARPMMEAVAISSSSKASDTEPDTE